MQSSSYKPLKLPIYISWEGSPNDSRFKNYVEPNPKRVYIEEQLQPYSVFPTWNLEL